MKSAGINIEHHLFKIKLTDPQNFVQYKQAEVDEKMISNYTNLKDIKVLSERYKLEHYLGLSEDDIQENEAMLKQERAIPEKGLDPRLTDLRMMYDDAWLENRPEIKVADDYEDFTAQTQKDGAEAPPAEDEKEEGKEGDEKEDDKDKDKKKDENPEDLGDLGKDISKL